MTDQRDQAFAPHAAVDLTDQNSMLLALEELGIAHMQNIWVQEHDPNHKDADALAAQAEEFSSDMLELLSVGNDPTRVVQNGWAGAALARHLRTALAVELADFLTKHGKTTPLEEISDNEVIEYALERYLEDVELLTKRDTEEKNKGRKVPAQEYMGFMIAWSGVFSGHKDRLWLPKKFLAYRIESGW